MTTFVRLLEVDSDRKGEVLSASAEQWKAGNQPDGVFAVDPTSFEQVPGSPFAYWVSERVRRLFQELPPFEGEGRTVKQGLATADDFRFVRCWWEVDAEKLSRKWFPFAKGGAYSPFYADLHLVVNWGEGGREIRHFCDPRTGRTFSRPQNIDFYFRPGLTWPLRKDRFTPVPLPSGCVFSARGYAAFVEFSRLPSTLALFSSCSFDHLFKLALGRFGFPEFVVGQLKELPWPQEGLAGSATELSGLALRAVGIERKKARPGQVDHAFLLPALLLVPGSSPTERALNWGRSSSGADLELDEIRVEIDGIAFDLFGISGEDRRQMEDGFAAPASEENAGLALTEGEEAESEVEGCDTVALTEALLEWALGVALGRFDIRLATGQRQPPPDPGPFDPLPVCSPGMLQDDSGLPAREAPLGYPLDLPPHGLLTDDPGHPWDVVARMEAVLALVAGDRAHAWLQEIEEILGLQLRDWLRRFGFERHLKRYSRSRRKAPLFWHLAPKSREYGLWLYSPVATRDTMYRILNDYLDPKLRSAERRLVELRQDAGASPTSQQRRELAGQESLVGELRAFREEVARVAPLWVPFRDDGVVLNCAVLHRLFDHHRTWQKECEAKWKELAKGKYDWAGWAMHLWPERVVKSCASDRSIAIAHGVEEDLWEEDEQGKWRPRKDARAPMARLTEARTSPALQAALDAHNRAG